MIGSEAQLLRLLDLDAGELAWFADSQQRGRRANASLQHYRWRLQPKRDGVRVIAAPKPRLKEIQRRLLRHVLTEIPLHPAAHGCVPGRSVRTAVEPHCAARLLVRLDLANFFPTINGTRVRGLFVARGYAAPLAAVIADLCTTSAPVAVWARAPRPVEPAALDRHYLLGQALRSPHLPQGAPTSPALANAVCFGLDRRLAALAARFGATYTRYVDDLTFSGHAFVLAHRHRFLDAVMTVVLDEGFAIAHRKTAVQTSAGRIHTLGAVLNERPRLPREQRDRLRAIVHNCVVHGGESQARGRPGFRAELLGHICAAHALDPAFGSRLRAEFDRIEWS